MTKPQISGPTALPLAMTFLQMSRKLPRSCRKYLGHRISPLPPASFRSRTTQKPSTIAAPNASVEEPANAAMVLL